MEKFSAKVEPRRRRQHHSPKRRPGHPPSPLKCAARADRFPGITDHPRRGTKEKRYPRRGTKGHEGPRRGTKGSGAACNGLPRSGTLICHACRSSDSCLAWIYRMEGQPLARLPFFVSLQAPTCLIWCPGVVCEKREERPQGRREISRETDEALRQTGCDRHGSAEIVPSGVARTGRIRSATSRSLAEQSGGEFTPAVSATRTRQARFQADANPPEIRHRSFFRLGPLQSATAPLLTGPFHAQPRRRTRRVASARSGLITCHRRRTQPCELSSDSAGCGVP